jgi:hypothetical protein
LRSSKLTELVRKLLSFITLPYWLLVIKINNLSNPAMGGTRNKLGVIFLRFKLQLKKLMSGTS